MPGEYTYEPYQWLPVYELAVAEKNPEHRQQLLIEAQRAVLERAYGLGETHGDDLECAVLDDAAAIMGDMIVKNHFDRADRARHQPERSFAAMC
jgi:hypothetical protein